jgi:hypothetical protein
MNKTNYALLIVLLILAFSTMLFANGNGDVSIKINGKAPGDWLTPIVVGCDLNFLEIWIMNDAPLSRLSIGLKFDNAGLPFELVTPYGSLPEGGAYLQEHGSAIGAFGPGGLTIDTSRLPDTLLLVGNSSTNPLPRHATWTLCYSMRIRIPEGQAAHMF